jgi:hypothetical protein
MQMAPTFRIFFLLIGCFIATNCLAQVGPAPREPVSGQHGDPFPPTNLVYQWNYVCPQANGARCQATIGEANFTSQVISFDMYLFAFTSATYIPPPAPLSYYYEVTSVTSNNGATTTKAISPFPTTFSVTGMNLVKPSGNVKTKIGREP